MPAAFLVTSSPNSNNFSLSFIIPHEEFKAPYFKAPKCYPVVVPLPLPLPLTPSPSHQFLCTVNGSAQTHLPMKCAQATLREKPFSVGVSYMSFGIRQTRAWFLASAFISHKFLGMLPNLSRPPCPYMHHLKTIPIFQWCL